MKTRISKQTDNSKNRVFTSPQHRQPNKNAHRHGFSLVELLAVIMIISILAGVTVSILQGRVDSAKWSEACTAAGTIRTAVTAFVARNGVEIARTTLVGNSLDDADTMSALGFIETDFAGTYFTAADYRITAIDQFGHATIEVTGSRDNAPEGTKTLQPDGSWQ